MTYPIGNTVHTPTYLRRRSVVNSMVRWIGKSLRALA